MFSLVMVLGMAGSAEAQHHGHRHCHWRHHHRVCRWY
jgi:hypothetical protein